MTQQKTQHSPLPWRAGYCDIIAADGHPAVTVRGINKADQAFIVRACNSHHALVDALETMCANAERESWSIRATPALALALNQARAALKLEAPRTPESGAKE